MKAAPWKNKERWLTCELCGGQYDPIQGVHAPACEVARTIARMALEGWVPALDGYGPYLTGLPVRKGPLRVVGFKVVEGNFYAVAAIRLLEDKTTSLPARLRLLAEMKQR